MLDLDELSPGIAVLGWNAELPPAGPSDPLGLTLRMGARLGAELLHCITSITPRARYYSLFPWAFHRALKRSPAGASLDQLIRLVLLDERAMVIGAVLHHNGQPCHGGGLAGTLRAQELWAGSGVVNLVAWEHLESATGAFAAYKGSLINLGLFTQSDAQADGEPGSDEEDGQLVMADLSPLGLAIAHAFENAVHSTEYINLDPRKPTSRDVLQQFGSAAGLCELQVASHADLPVLRSLFFAEEIERHDNSHFRRRMSLLLLMYAVDAANAFGLRLTEGVFDDFTFYRRFFRKGDGELSPVVQLPPRLDDICERWRVFHFHSYLTVSLHSLLVGVVRAIRTRPGGMSLPEIIDEFDNPSAHGAFSHQLGLSQWPATLDASPADLLAAAGLDVYALLDRETEAIDRLQSSVFIERDLRSLLLDSGAVRGSAGPISAALLLFSLLLRHDVLLGDIHKGWTRAKIANLFSDVALTGISDALVTYFGQEWWLVPTRQVLERILWRFVIMQHQAMSYERGFGGSAPLFHVDGSTVVGTDLDQDEVAPSNARFPSALQILEDLALIEITADQAVLNQDGTEWLRRWLAEAA